MIYLPFIIVIAIGIYVILNERIQIQAIKSNGVRVAGMIIENNRSRNKDNSFYQLGGNLNNPTIQFTTTEGKEIIGRPIVGFASQFEIAVPSEVYIIYSSKNPEKFCIDIS